MMKEQDIYLRKVNENDINLTFKWFNDKDVRKNLFSTKEITWQEHENWFKSTINDPKIIYYILRYKGGDAGQIRIKLIDSKSGVISYNIDSKYRGLGLEKTILCLCENVIAEKFSEFYLLTEVKKSNIASQYIFKNLGYEENSIQNDILKYRKKACKAPQNITTTTLYEIIFLANNKNSLRLFEYIKNQNIKCLLYSDTLTKELINNAKPKLIISYNYSSIILEEIIKYAKSLNIRIINMHISLLPWNKGSNPNFWSFMENTPKGVSIHDLEPALDSGKIIYQKELFFDENAESLKSSYDKLQNAITELFIEHFDEIISKNYTAFEQKVGGSYHDKKMYDNFLAGRSIDYDKKISTLKHNLGLK